MVSNTLPSQHFDDPSIPLHTAGQGIKYTLIVFIKSLFFTKITNWFYLDWIRTRVIYMLDE